MPAALKELYNEDFINALVQALTKEHPSFKGQRFINSVFDSHWPQRELKDRMHHISHCLHDCLGLPFPKAIALLRKIAPDFSGFAAMIFPDYVEHYGQDYVPLAIDALADLTRYSSSEFAVRPFIERHPDLMLAQLLSWAQNDNPHVRRLASEGCRPRLPWARALEQFKQDPTPLLPILTQLRHDPSDYVRRSVANNLNDISKDHPECTLSLCAQWWGQHRHSDWIVKHGLRTLLKQGNATALALVGHHRHAHISHAELTLDKNHLAIGDTLTLFVNIRSDEALGPLRLEYRIRFRKKNGTYTAKVFHLSKGEQTQSQVQLSKQHVFRQMSTRLHYPGQHSVHLIVNGEEKSQAIFELLPKME